MAKSKRGPTALDLLALGGIAALVVVLVLPRLSGLKIDHNERDAVHALSILHQRLTALRNDRRGVDPTERTPLSRLLRPDADGRPPLDDCELSKSSDGTELLVRHGYVIRIDYAEAPLDQDGLRPFDICAVPLSYGETGSLAYAVTHGRELLRSRNLARRYDVSNPPSEGAFRPLRRDQAAKEKEKAVPTDTVKGAYDALDGTQWEVIDWPAQP
ncbi:MAG: hypothetical protein IPN34_03520 [Planctomycetes bacterium]|nr:hypothetical protein [Planctomycetota bacterium]